jgi:hypothetical protein
MKGKRGRPATGRKDTYYVPDPNNFRKHLHKQNVERLINAYDYIHLMAFDIALSWSQKRDFRKDKIKGI